MASWRKFSRGHFCLARVEGNSGSIGRHRKKLNERFGEDGELGSFGGDGIVVVAGDRLIHTRNHQTLAVSGAVESDFLRFEIGGFEIDTGSKFAESVDY